MTTTGSEFVRSIPEEHTPAREAAILAAVERGDHLIHWRPLTIKSADGFTRLTIFVSTDALKIGTPSDSVRVAMTHETAQRVADLLGAVLPTAKLADLTWQAADVKLTPHTQDPDHRMSATAAFVNHHAAIEEERRGRCGLLRTLGKDYINTRKLEGRPTRSAIYGWHAPRAPYQAATEAGGHVWQPVGTTHILDKFSDYSAFPTYVLRSCIFRLGDNHGVERDLNDIATDPQLCSLISSEGPLELRHPGVGPWLPGDSHAPQPSLPVVRPMPLFTRTLRYTKPNMNGDDVAFVQGVVGATADGYFGPRTKAAVQRWQLAHGLTADGIVGPRTRATMFADVGVLPEVPDGFVLEDIDLVHLPYLECRNFTRTTRTDVALLVLHSMEAVEKGSTAEAVASWGAGSQAPRASWHYAVDNDSIVSCVPETAVAWCAPGANATGVHYELAGYARQSRAEWLDAYSEQLIWNAARLATLVTMPRWGIPLRYVDAAGVKAGYDLFKAGQRIPDELRGWTTHRQVSKGVRKSDHMDPGRHFPGDVFEDFVRQAGYQGT